MRALNANTASRGQGQIGDDAAWAEINALLKYVKALRNPLAGGSTRTLTADNDGDVILLDTAAGSVITLPAATGSGMAVQFLVSVKPTSNFHQVKVANASDTMSGSVNLLDNDSNAQTAYAASGTDDNIQLNGTTKGGQVGDWVEVVDVKANVWAIRGQLVCPAGSNVADPFSAAVS